MNARSTAPAGLASYRPAVDDRADTLFWVYGVNAYGELIGLGGPNDGLEPLECLGLDAVREAVRTKTHGWDVAGPRYVHTGETEDPDSPLAHGIELPTRHPVRSWRVVDVEAAGGRLPEHAFHDLKDPLVTYDQPCGAALDSFAPVETWVMTGDGPRPLSALV